MPNQPKGPKKKNWCLGGKSKINLQYKKLYPPKNTRKYVPFVFLTKWSFVMTFLKTLNEHNDWKHQNSKYCWLHWSFKTYKIWVAMYEKHPLKHSLNVYFIILKFDEFSKNDSVHSLWSWNFNKFQSSIVRIQIANLRWQWFKIELV